VATYLRDTLSPLSAAQDGPCDAAWVLALKEEGLGFAVLEAEDFAVGADEELALWLVWLAMIVHTSPQNYCNISAIAACPCNAFIAVGPMRPFSSHPSCDSNYVDQSFHVTYV